MTVYFVSCAGAITQSLVPAFSVLFCWTGDCQDSEGELAGLAIQGLYGPGGRCAVALIIKFSYSYGIGQYLAHRSCQFLAVQMYS